MSDVLDQIRQMGFDAVMANNLFEIVRITREAAFEECAKIADSARLSAAEHHGIEASIGADIAARRIRASVSAPGESS